MPIFDVTVLSEDSKTEIYHDKIMAVDDESALDQVIIQLNRQGITYGMCMADEV